MLPPLAVKVELLPLHITGADGVIEMVGPAITLTVTVPVLWQPLLLVPVTVYSVVAVGFTVGLKMALIVAGGLADHEYDVRLAGAAVKTTDVAAHTLLLPALALITGNAFTVTVKGTEAETHPVIVLDTTKVKS